LDNFFNWTWEMPMEELVMDFIDGFVLHDVDKEEECWQKRWKKADSASIDSKAVKSLKSVMQG
jgi:hypothetical protein